MYSVSPQHEEANYLVMQGRHLHDEKLEQNKEYLRKRLGVVEKRLDQYLTNDLIRGRMDEVLTLQDGYMAPLDYKFAEYKDRVYDTYRTQLYCYAWLIEENFGQSVNRGFLVYTRSKNKVVEVAISEENKAEVKKAATDIFDIIDQNRYPKATKYKARCVSCTYRNMCIK